MTTPAVRGVGCPTRLTPARIKIISDAVGVGMTWTAAAQYAGVSYSSLMIYKRTGAQAMEAVAALLDTLDPDEWERIDALDDEHRTDGEPTERDLALEQFLPERERPYFRLFRSIERALAFFELQNLTLVQEAAAGYGWEETTTVTKRDAQGNVLDTTTTTTRKRARHWQAAMTLLERRIPERYAQVSRHEHAGLGGGPIVMENTAAERIRQLPPADRDARTAEVLRILADVNAIDAEVIEDVVVSLPEPHGNGEG